MEKGWMIYRNIDARIEYCLALAIFIIAIQFY